MTRLCFLLGDQLSESLSSLTVIDKHNDVVFLCEVIEEATYVAHHPKKIAFLFSAMRHFSKRLKALGYRVRYTKYDDAGNTGNFENELYLAIKEEQIAEVHVTYPGEWRVLQKLETLKKQLPIPLIVHEDTRFLCPLDEFKFWSKDKKQLRMEYFYRMMRQKHDILIENKNRPLGGSWNYDEQNRKNANHVETFPSRIVHPIDKITSEVLSLVEKEFANHFGQLQPFNFAVTREQALDEANDFIAHCLAFFGDYQDAMRSDEANLYHSKLSFYLNAGLLLPLELCRMAEDALKKKTAPLNAVEGFIRQILGWREYVRGIYWLLMPDYANKNYFNATKPLPSLFWGEHTQMFCMKEVIRQTRVEAYSHHIQRLMITGNFALLAGINPKEVCEWYLGVYADAYEWVELPNTLGMALYADGGVMASKPYAASGKYIQKMSNFCKSCAYNPAEVTGEKACPFNSLYWNFIATHQNVLKNNPRLHYAYLNWDKMEPEKKKGILTKATEVLSTLANGRL
ncbi:Deoxyribodipyrimidine photolyase-related protein [Legionella quinlivanii]|uniref:Deoxyribodipyrimidine photolyase-related protein n=1 Tax=Legionella quinlivanii TaxID=45073 RepID=A0A0W0XPQ2_9GAMM|nr:cryptochrome/photolyase family protein [Legionella quinlivanii]KTD46565.1 Deoxyribodipyrimidine photolyase-related protein [Legionella quinlivanii]SEG09151.1 deoxyribodipyrimidine photolyase-related protein [Legionella quinlivanii DSM 21216]STY10253.1 Deoxyribodipyrimidine photolyase-related protein [Legionella quinlivanii]